MSPRPPGRGRLQDRRAVITQVSAFMGPELVPCFEAEGATVVADDRDLTAPGAAGAFRERMKATPIGRLAHGWESAALALFLAGDESDFFVGQVFPFSGGWVTR